MSARPGYQELVATRGREVADRIIDLAETYSDSAHQSWDEALAWAIDYHDRPVDPVLAAQQAENSRLYRDLMERRGDQGRRILYLAVELGGDAFEYPAHLAAAERIYDAEGWRLGPTPSIRDELDWAAERAREQGPGDDPVNVH